MSSSRSRPRLSPPTPVRAITEFTYVDAAGDAQTLVAADYELEPVTLGHARLWPSARSWPGTSASARFPITLRFDAGVEAPEDVAVPLKKAILLLAAYFTESNRDQVFDESSKGYNVVESLIAPYRVREVPY